MSIGQFKAFIQTALGVLSDEKTINVEKYQRKIYILEAQWWVIVCGWEPIWRYLPIYGNMRLS